MPNWEVELTYTTGQHQAVTKTVNIEDCNDRNVALFAGIKECLQWGADEGTIPAAAWDYWQEARSGAMQPYEVLTDLESRWQLTFNIRQATHTAATEVPVKRGPTPPHRNGTSTPPASFDLKAMLAEQLRALMSRQNEIIRDRKGLDAEYQENLASIADIRSFLMISASKHRPRKKENRNVGQPPHIHPDSPADES